MKRILFFVVLVTLSISAWAKTVECTSSQATAADALIDDLDSWQRVKELATKYGQCDDGGIAEGTSEAIARLLVDKWSTVNEAQIIIKQKIFMKIFILRHIDSTLSEDDLRKIKELSMKYCPSKLAPLCKDINIAANRASSNRP